MIENIKEKPNRAQYVFRAVVVGIVVGLVVSLFRFLIEILFEKVVEMYRLMQVQPWLIPVWLCVSLLVGTIIAFLVKADPMIKGSGIPQIEGQLADELEMNWFSIVWRKGIGGVLAISSGLFLGREGPSIQLGAALGDGVNHLFKGDYLMRKTLISSGAGAGLAAAFNAPLAGLMFVLEEVHRNFSPLILVTTLIATSVANFVSLHIFGQQAVINIGVLSSIPLSAYVSLVGLGVCLGVAGVLYQKVVLWIPSVYQKLKGLPPHFYGLIPFVLVVPIGLWNPNVLGGGSIIIDQLIHEQPSLGILILVLVLRFVFSMISYGSGLPGGIFLPILSLGSLWGALWGWFMIEVFGMDPQLYVHFIVLGMAGYFTAIGKAPITAILLIAEMTGSLAYLMPLGFVSIIAYVVSDVCGGEPVYEAMLERLLETQASSDHRIRFTTTLSVDCGCVNQQIKTIKWPKDTLIIAIERGHQDLIPHGDTILKNGDIVSFSTYPKHVDAIKQKINRSY